MFVGALGYADDLCLITPSRQAICTLLSICESYGIEYDVKFNSKKSHFIVFDNKNVYNNIPPLMLNGEIIHA